MVYLLLIDLTLSLISKYRYGYKYRYSIKDSSSRVTVAVVPGNGYVYYSKDVYSNGEESFVNETLVILY